jgi:hypothetical protein
MEETQVTNEVQLYEPQPAYGTLPDKTLDELTEELNAISTQLTNLFGMIPCPIEIDGNPAKFKYVRMRTGYKIEIGLKSLLVQKHEFLTRLIHELVHVYHDSEFIVDACGNGAYHTEIFGNQIKNWGCHAVWSRGYGFAGQINLKKDFVDQLDGILASNLDYNILEPETALLKKTRSANSSKFQAKVYQVTCPHCGQTLHVQQGNVVSAPTPEPTEADVTDLLG